MPGLERETGMMYTYENKLYLMITIKQLFLVKLKKKTCSVFFCIKFIHCIKDISYSTSHNRASTYQAGINTIIGISIINFFSLQRTCGGKH